MFMCRTDGVETVMTELAKTGNSRIEAAVKLTRKSFSKFDDNKLIQKFLAKVLEHF